MQPVLIYSSSRQTLLFTAWQSDLKLQRQPKGGTNTVGGGKNCEGECTLWVVLIYSLSRPTLLITASKSDLKLLIQPKGGTDTGGGGKHWDGGGHTVTNFDLLVDQTNFAFYSIKIRLETPEISARLATWLRTHRQTDRQTHTQQDFKY